jgi:undecaprenyl diphosphate synthase
MLIPPPAAIQKLAAPSAGAAIAEIPDSLPRHVAIIMDGNGRWAGRFGWKRTRGHREGAESVRAVVRECARLGIEALTLFAFSSENWRRPKAEVAFLMALLERYLIEERPEIIENSIRLRAIGEIEGLPPRIREELRRTIELSREHAGLTLTLALNYGGRGEIVRAVRRIVEGILAGGIRPEEVDARLVGDHLDTAGIPDPDIIIRTGGEMRLSGFLLWQAEYSEIYVTETPWPEFREASLHEALRAYASRERRFGGLI